MGFNDYLRNLRHRLMRQSSATKSKGARTSRRRSFGPLLEVLEDRITPNAVPPYTVNQILTAYGINAIPNFESFGGSGGQVANGTGQTIAIVDAYNDPTIGADLATFDQNEGLAAPPSFQVFNEAGTNITTGPGNYTTNFTTSSVGSVPGVDPTGPGSPTSWETEESLDVEWAHAIAPGANIDLIECNNSGSLLTGVSTAAGLPQVSVVSMSWGFGASNGENGNDGVFVHSGVTFVNGSGDNGWPSSYPGESPNVLAVGGTNLALNNNGTYQSETAWSGSGGGTSPFEGAPTYQNGLQNTGQRTNPDVAFIGGTNVQLVDTYDPLVGADQVDTITIQGSFSAGDSFALALNGTGIGTVDATQSLNGIAQTIQTDLNTAAGTNNTLVVAVTSSSTITITYQNALGETPQSLLLTPAVTSGSVTIATTTTASSGGIAGTSLSAPCWAGLIAIANQGRALGGAAPLNSFNPQEVMQVLYGIGGNPTQYAQDFNDITSGTNIQVSSVVVNTGGSGYSTVPITVNFNGGAGGGATATAVTSLGQVIGINVTNGGAWTSAPTVSVTGGGGSGVTGLTVNLSGGTTGTIQSINIPGGAVGMGFLSVDFTGGGAPAQSATGVAIVNGSGQITGVTLTTGKGGGGFTSAPTVVFNGTTGTPATATAVINGFAAGVGYDEVTGLGTPIANNLIPALVTAPTQLFGIGPANSLAPERSDRGVALASVNNQTYLAGRGDGNQFLQIMPLTAGGAAVESLHFSSSVTCNKAPALATLNGQLYVAWTGQSGNHDIFVAPVNIDSTGAITLGAATDTGQNTGQSPALAAFGNNLYVAFTGNGDNLLRIMELTSGLSLAQTIYTTGAPVNGSPSLAASGGQLFVAWADPDGDHQLLVSTVNAGGDNSVPPPASLPEHSDQSPTLADYDGQSGHQPVIAFSGTSNHLVIVLPLNINASLLPRQGGITADETDRFISSYTADDGNNIDFDRPQEGPALESVNGNVFIAWVGRDPNHRIIFDAPVSFTRTPIVLPELSLIVHLDSSNPNSLQVYQGGTFLKSYQVGTFNEIEEPSAAGSTTLTLDFGNGNFLPSAGLTFDGGTAGNGTLILENGNFTDEVITPSGPTSGTISLDGAIIAYNNVTSIIDTTTVTNLTMNGTNSAGELVNIVNDPSGSENGGTPTDEINSSGGTFAKVDFGNKMNVTFQGGTGGDTYNVNATTAAANLATLAVDGSSPGTDTYNVQATLPGVPVGINTGPGTSIVNVAPASENLFNIAGALTVTGGAGGTTTLIVDGQNDSLAQTITVTSSTVQMFSSALITYNSVQGVMVTSGNLSAINVNSTAQGTPVTVASSTGTCAVNVAFTNLNLVNIAGPLTVIGGASALTNLAVDDQNDAPGQTYTITNSTVQDTNCALITYSNLHALTLNGGPGADVYNVLSTASGTATKLNLMPSSSGFNAVNVGAETDGNDGPAKVDGIQGALTVSGSGGDALYIYDGASHGPKTGTLTATALTGLNMGAGGITYSGLSSLFLDLGSGADTVTVQNTAADMVTDINTEAGMDTINVQATTGEFDLETDSEASNTINIGSLAPATGGNVNGIQGKIHVIGGLDTINVDDTGSTAPKTGVLASNSLTGLNMGPSGIVFQISLTKININLGSGGNTFTIRNTPFGTTKLNSGTGSDLVYILATLGPTTVNTGGNSNPNTVLVTPVFGGEDQAPSGGIVNTIQGALTVVGGGNDTLSVFDNRSTQAKTGTLMPTTLTGLGMVTAGITYSGLTQLNIYLGSGGNTFTIQNTAAATTTFLNSGTSVDVVNVLATAGPTTVNTGNDGQSNTVNVGSLAPATGGVLNGVQGALTIVGGGQDTLNADDTGDTTARTGTLTATALTGLGMGSGGVAYSGLARFNINLGSSGNHFTIQNTAAVTTTDLNSGTGSDIVNVRATTGPTQVNTGGNSTSNTVNVGSLAPATGGTLAGVLGLTVIGGGVDTLNVDDTGNHVAQAGTLQPFNISLIDFPTGALDIFYIGLAQLNINLGSGGNTFFVSNTEPGTTTNLNSGTGSDTVNVHAVSGPTTVNTGGNSTSNIVNVGSLEPAAGGTLAGVQGVLTVVGGGHDILDVDDTGDSAAQTGVLTATALTGLGLGSAGIAYSGLAFLNINLGSGGNTFTIQNTAPGTTTDLTSGTGGATVNVQACAGPTTVNNAGATVNVGSLAPATGGTLAGVQGALTVTAYTLNVDDTGDSAAQTGVLTATALTGLSFGITYSGLAFLNINLGSGGNYFTIQNTEAGTSTRLNSGLGSDTVNVRATSGPTTVITGGNGSASTVTVGSLAPAGGGTLAGVLGLTVIGAGADTLNVDDSGDSAPQGGTLQAANISLIGFPTGAMDIFYIGLAQLNISLGSGGNTFFVSNTEPGTTTDLNSGTGSDSVTVQAISSPVSINGQGNSGSSLNVNLHADFTQTLAVSGFAAMSFQTTGNFSGQLLAPTEGTAAAPVSVIDVGGSVAASGVIKVNFLAGVVVTGDMAGTLKAFGSDPATTSIQAITIFGNLTSTGVIEAPTFGTLHIFRDDGGNIAETNPTQDFQSVEIDGNLLATGNITAASGGTLTIDQDLDGNVYIAGILDTLIVDGNFNGTVYAFQINHELPLGNNWGSHVVTGHSSVPIGTVTTQTPTFIWPAVNGATNYDLWLSDKSTGRMVLSQNVTGTSYTLTTAQSLSPGDSYSWWAGMENARGAVTNWGNSSTFTLPPLAVPTANTPNNTLTTDQPTFSWTAGTGATIAAASYELWILDQTTQRIVTIANLPVNATSYTLTAAQALTPGDPILWYVGAVSANGRTTAWSNGVNAAVAAINAQPTANTPNTTSTTDQPTFTWTAGTSTGTPPTSYTLWIQDQTTLNIETIPNLPLGATYYTLTAAQALTPGHAFSWYVGATSTNGKATDWSNGVNVAIAAIADQPTANTPTGKLTTDQPTFSWTAGTSTGTPPAAFELWIQDLATQQITTIPNLPLNATSYTLTAAQALTPGDPIVWYVGAASTNGKAASWSNAVNLSISGLNAGPTANAPSGILDTDQPTFSWTPQPGTATPAASYELWILDQTTQQITTITNLPTNATSYTLTTAQALTPGRSFLWYVGAVSTNSKKIAWSNGVNMSIAASAAPTANTPASMLNTDQPTFSWTAGTATGTPSASYELWIQDQTTMNIVTVPNLPLGSTSYTLTAAQALTPGHPFVWYVGAVSTNAKAIAWSNGVNSAVAGLNIVPTAQTPSSTLSTDRPTFSWSSITGTGTAPASYELWIQDLTNLKIVTIPNLPLGSTAYTLTAAQALTPGHPFVWFVGAVSTNGQAIAWSNGVNFGIAPLAVPVTTNLGGTITSATPTFNWTAVNGADHYDVWVDDETSGVTQVLRNQDVTGTSLTVAANQALSIGDSYVWWVAAVSTNGQAEFWSVGQDFTIA